LNSRAANNQVRLAEMAVELVALKVDLIVASSTPSVIAARKATTVIPIVTISADPVGNGFVQSLRNPGGNITGISTISPALSG
jgi:putative ABC transport system substrate-binding protein